MALACLTAMHCADSKTCRNALELSSGEHNFWEMCRPWIDWYGHRHNDLKQGFKAHRIESDNRLAVVKCLEGAWVVLFKVVIDG